MCAYGQTAQLGLEGRGEGCLRRVCVVEGRGRAHLQREAEPLPETRAATIAQNLKTRRRRRRTQGNTSQDTALHLDTVLRLPRRFPAPSPPTTPRQMTFGPLAG